mgnify:CR=1 FL=1
MNELIYMAQEVQNKFCLSSDFTAGSVGAALKTNKGNIYTGICINLACGIGFCAEHAAIAEMLKHSETQIDIIVAVSKEEIISPCGRCREMMVQIDRKNLNTKVMVTDEKIITLKDLIPYYWDLS